LQALDGHLIELFMAKTRASSTSDASQAAPVGDDSGMVGLRYEDALAELEQLVERIESGAMPIDDLLTQYRRGAQLLNFCRQRLVQVEDQVKVLEDGELKPWRGGA
jgi:exodeoxyribonuclease VII small subunit